MLVHHRSRSSCWIAHLLPILVSLASRLGLSPFLSSSVLLQIRYLECSGRLDLQLAPEPIFEIYSALLLLLLPGCHRWVCFLLRLSSFLRYLTPIAAPAWSSALTFESRQIRCLSLTAQTFEYTSLLRSYGYGSYALGLRFVLYDQLSLLPCQHLWSRTLPVGDIVMDPSPSAWIDKPQPVSHRQLYLCHSHIDIARRNLDKQHLFHVGYSLLVLLFLCCFLDKLQSFLYISSWAWLDHDHILIDSIPLLLSLWHHPDTFHLALPFCLRLFIYI